MKKIILLIIFISTRTDGVVYQKPSHRVVAPFGISTGQPPSVHTIQLVDAELGFKASQVCGYTDWSTVQLQIPKELLSKQYWQKIGDQLGNRARNVVLQISGALPSMIACNISPQYCSVYNQAEAMAGFEASLTSDSCKILDGLSDATQLHHEPYRQCVFKEMSEGSTFPGQAMAKCNTGDTSRATSKEDRARNLEQKVHDKVSITMEEIIEKIFPNTVKTRNNNQELNSGGRKYSRYFTTKTFAQELFPGISVNGSAKVMHGGTFQDSPETRQRKEKEEIKGEVKEIFGKMVAYKQEGFSDHQIIEKSKPMWNDKEKWKRDGKPSAIYRPAKDDEEPSLLIQPSQILMLLPLADMDNSSNGYMSDELDMIIEQLSSNASYIKQIDKLRDLYAGAEQKCLTDPELHSAVAQKNCDLIISRTKASIEMLLIKQESEDRAFELNQRIAQRVQTRKMQKIQRFSNSPVGGSDNGLYQDNGAIPVPGKY